MSVFLLPTLEPVINRVLDALGGAKFKLDVEVQNRKIDRLYTMAKRDQWNLDDNREHFFPPDRGGIDLNEWLGVDDDVRIAAARCFSSFYYGEHGAKVISAQLVNLMPTNESSKFMATQVMDEARHVEVFEGILGFIDRIHPMNPFLNAFLGDISRVRHTGSKLIGMNLLVEGLALSSFRMILREMRAGANVSPRGYRAIGEPIESIIRDESRHVGFGVVILPELLHKIPRRIKAEMRIRQLAWLGLLYGSVKYHQEDQEKMGLDYVQLLSDVIDDHEKRIQDCGGDALVSTERMKSLVPTMDRIVDRFRRKER
ncbi:MAG: ferritin-like domain-containing protein [Planctomycetes bacterium]|nr:ferritin-like domain-containing protein [Planctomycetota bacterium]